MLGHRHSWPGCPESRAILEALHSRRGPAAPLCDPASLAVVSHAGSGGQTAQPVRHFCRDKNRCSGRGLAGVPPQAPTVAGGRWPESSGRSSLGHGKAPHGAGLQWIAAGNTDHCCGSVGPVAQANPCWCHLVDVGILCGGPKEPRGNPLFFAELKAMEEKCTTVHVFHGKGA